MRKVFLSNIILNKINKNTQYISDDFQLPQKQFAFLMSYFLESSVNEGDEVAVITCYTNEALALENYGNFKKEAEKLLQQKHAKYEFIDVEEDVEFESVTFNAFFKKIVKKLRNDDKLYLDLTFGMKPYSVSLFIAAFYAVKACENATVEIVFYSQLYKGQKTTDNILLSKVYDITTLFFLNEIAGKLHKGDKTDADRMLDILISDN